MARQTDGEDGEEGGQCCRCRGGGVVGWGSMAGKGSHQGKRVEPGGSVAAADALVPAPVPAPVPQRTFWQHPFVLNVLPFTTSVLLHAGILLVGYATFQTVKTVSTVIREQIIIPDATLVEGAEVGGLPNPGLGADPNIVPDVKVDIQEQTQRLEKSTSIASGIGGEPASEGVIGVGAAKLGGGGLGKGDEAGRSPFGVPGGSGGLGPKSPFMGVSGNAYRIVYLVDGSGSMLSRRNIVIQALKESVDKLKPVQFFNVMFFHEGDFEALDRGQLLPASPVNKRKAFDFADQMETRDRTDPSRAIQLAMNMKPQLIYLLTDGFDDRVEDFAKKLRGQISALNKSREAHVNIIYIADESRFSDIGGVKNDAKRNEIVDELKAITQENGGRFKSINSNGDAN